MYSCAAPKYREVGSNTHEKYSYWIVNFACIHSWAALKYREVVPKYTCEILTIENLACMDSCAAFLVQQGSAKVSGEIFMLIVNLACINSWTAFQYRDIVSNTPEK